MLPFLEIFNIIYLFLAGMIILIFGRFLGKNGVFAFLVWLICMSTFFLCANAFVYDDNNVVSKYELLSWIAIHVYSLNWSFCFNSFTKTMLLVINLISFCVIAYSFIYMKSDPHIIRFYGYICFFIFFMQLLIASNNFILLFLGWEGVGICSYLLVNFWFTRVNANKSAIKALLVNRFGDLSLVLGLGFFFLITGTSNMHVGLPLIPYLTNVAFPFFSIKINIIVLISLFFIVGAVGKSAQIGLHTWLPDAMEGPTPISALIHAATMVTAGVLLIIKSAPVLEESTLGLLVLIFVGGLTSLFAASLGLFQTDIKKIIAYSTCSQLGYMIFICGLSNYIVSFFHLTNHAFFKALLFLCAGSVIHSVLDEQDLRKYGSLFHSLIFTAVCFLIGGLTLTGIPFLSGFYSKDVILELAATSYTLSGWAVYWGGILTAVFTLIYTYKIFYLSFLTKNMSSRNAIYFTSESLFLTNGTLLLLAVASILYGWMSKEKFIGLGTNFFGQLTYVNVTNNNIAAAEFAETIYKLFPFFFILIGLLFISNVSRFNWILSKNKIQIYHFFSKKGYFDAVYNNLLNKPFLNTIYWLFFINLDKGFFELFGPNGVASILLKTNFGFNYKLTHTGFFFTHTAYVIFSILFLFFLNV